jgi:hypothetical protein
MLKNRQYHVIKIALSLLPLVNVRASNLCRTNFLKARRLIQCLYYQCTVHRVVILSPAVLLQLQSVDGQLSMFADIRQVS